MTRKHYIAIAECLQYGQFLFKSDEDFDIFCRYMGQTVGLFNDNFNMNRFIEACHTIPDPVEQEELL